MYNLSGVRSVQNYPEANVLEPVFYVKEGGGHKIMHGLFSGAGMFLLLLILLVFSLLNPHF